MGQDLRKEATCVLLSKHANAQDRADAASKALMLARSELRALEDEIRFRGERDGGLCLVYGDRAYLVDDPDENEWRLTVAKVGLSFKHDHHLSPAGQPDEAEGGDMPSTGEAILATAAQAWGGGA